MSLYSCCTIHDALQTITVGVRDGLREDGAGLVEAGTRDDKLRGIVPTNLVNQS